MFVWFSNDTTIYEAITKLILVITGSVLIIFTCQKLTNFKKTRRYKYDFIRANQHQQAFVGQAQEAPGLGANGQFRQHRWTQHRNLLDLNGQPVAVAAAGGQPFIAAYDPYNTSSSSSRPIAGLGAPGHAYPIPNSTTAANSPYLAAYAGYHHPSAALAAYQGLAPLNLSQAANLEHQLNNIDLARQQLYPTNVPADCSGLLAHQLDGHQLLPEPASDADDSCPTYEEAIRASQQEQTAPTSVAPTEEGRSAAAATPERESEPARATSETETNDSAIGAAGDGDQAKDD